MVALVACRKVRTRGAYVRTDVHYPKRGLYSSFRDNNKDLSSKPRLENT